MLAVMLKYFLCPQVIFHIVLLATGTSLQEAADAHWVMQPEVQLHRPTLASWCCKKRRYSIQLALACTLAHLFAVNHKQHTCQGA